MEQQDSPNVFQTLFAFRPRDASIPAENFLTEALVYVLRTSPGAMNAWLVRLLGKKHRGATLETRASIRIENDVTNFPDVVVRESTTGNNGRVIAVVEHKWGAPYDKRQLERYGKWLSDSVDRGDALPDAHLIFVAADPSECERAKRHMTNSDMYGDRGVALLWEDIYYSLSQVDPKEAPLCELLEFMKRQGLAPLECITEPMLQGLMALTGKAIENRRHETVELLRAYLGKVAALGAWDKQVVGPFCGSGSIRDIPRVVKHRGAVLMEWKPDGGMQGTVLSLGIVYDTSDLGVRAGKSGADLFLRLEAEPEQQVAGGRFPQLTEVLKRNPQKKPDNYGPGAMVHTAADQKDMKNDWTLLLVHRDLWDILSETSGTPASQGQVDVLHATLQAWCKTVLVDDADVKDALRGLTAASQ